MSANNKTNRFLAILLLSISLTLLSMPAFSANKVIARLTDFSGTVLVKSQGSWGIELKKGIPLYSDDKVATRTGTATITFTDGAVMELKGNSNLRMMEQEEEKGFFKKVKVVKRRLRLLLGKMIFKIGRSNTSTSLETATMVCGLRGTAGTLSIGADGRPYLQFTEGGAAFTIGDFISGVAEDVPAELADLNPAQRAAFVAAAAADQAKRAAEKAQELVDAGEGETDEARKAQAQVALARAEAAEAAAREVKVQATIIAQNNPDATLVEEANAAISQADKAIEAAEEAQEQAIDAGATPGELEPGEEPEEGEEEPGEVEPYEEEPGFDIPVGDEPPIQDTEAGSPV